MTQAYDLMDRVYGGLVGGAVGDALGAPVEAMCIGPIGVINAGNPREAARDAYEIASLSHDGYSRDAAVIIAGGGVYRPAVLGAANFGRDCDTIACMTGYIAGAFRGASGVPSAWIDQMQEIQPRPDYHELATGVTAAVEQEIGCERTRGDELIPKAGV